MRARIEQVDAQHEAFVYEADMADLRAVADECAGLRGVGATGSSEMKHVAKVPAILVYKYMHDNGVSYAEFMRNNAHQERFLADPAVAHFRIWQGRV